MSRVRERILEAASELFYRKGIQAVGVDAIIARADVARMSFYRHFQSKEGLVLAYLERREAQWQSWLRETVERLAPNPVDRPLALFDALAQRLDTPHYRGCAFINAMAEVADREEATFLTAAALKGRTERYLAQLLSEAGHREALALDLLLLLDGAIVSWVRLGDSTSAHRAKRLASLLLEHDTSTPQARAS
jgi:AcrR family transcriptional regulator